MTITRHEYPLTPGRPIISRAVEHGGIVYVCGVTPDPVGNVATQTKQVLDRIDEALRLASVLPLPANSLGLGHCSRQTWT